MKELIQQYAAYNRWANTRIVGRLQREGPAVMDRPVKSSFPSLRLTILHIRDSGNAWYGRIFGEGPPVSGPEIGSLPVLCAALADKVRGLDEAGLAAPVTYARANGMVHTQPRWQLLAHCFNHASYHRGQVITMMRELDLGDVPNTDLVAFQRLLMA